jgi:serine/threonine protein kinase
VLSDFLDALQVASAAPYSYLHAIHIIHRDVGEYNLW